jgi:renalase
MKSNVAIIGAGMSGLSCATVLRESGITVTLFEKSRGISGRMSTRRGENWQCDHGAQYFTARDPGFRAEVERWRQSGVAGLWQPRMHVFGDSFLHRSDEFLERYVGVPAMTSPGGLLAADLDIYKEVQIDKIERKAGGWRLSGLNDRVAERDFSAVILAMPAPQAAALLAQPAPHLAELAAPVTMRACHALMLCYDEPLNLPFDAAFVNDGPLRWIARDNSKPGRDSKEIWVLHASAEWSERYVERSAQEIAALLLPAFCALGASMPQSWAAHRWRYADSKIAETVGSIWNVQQKLGICGDWLHGGKVEGAWLSGRHLAMQMLNRR